MFFISQKALQLDDLRALVFQRSHISSISIDEKCLAKVKKSYQCLMKLMETKVPMYGITTGFGDSSSRIISVQNSEELQKNLISYLLCGTGENLSIEISRATLAIRLRSLCNGFSGVSLELIERMRLYLEKDWLPVIPREGSLGASGDLIPLAYLAQVLQGDGQIYIDGNICATKEVLKQNGIEPYQLKPKEGLAIVNGTTVMAAAFLVNVQNAKFLLELNCLLTAWLTISMKGRTEAFEPLVNEMANRHPGQIYVAKQIRKVLHDESYISKPIQDIHILENIAQEPIQDRYSLRCTPQILGPVYETISLLEVWLQDEVNGVSDNPLFDGSHGAADKIAMGGNFYGGFLSQGMDYLKISLAHIADLIDRQFMTLVDEKSNRGLPPNLANWSALPENERFLHHGLKGLHQATNAITSEILARAIPNGIFSRSSESHNQDKVSLGMSAAMQCSQMIDPLFTITSMYMAGLAQAFDLRKIQVKSEMSQKYYKMIRNHISFVAKDRPLGTEILELSLNLRQLAFNEGRIF